MNHPRCTLSAVSSPDCRYIYAMGGFDGSALNLVERYLLHIYIYIYVYRYDVMKDIWEFVTPLMHKRFMHASAIITESLRDPSKISIYP